MELYIPEFTDIEPVLPLDTSRTALSDDTLSQRITDGNLKLVLSEQDHLRELSKVQTMASELAKLTKEVEDLMDRNDDRMVILHQVPTRPNTFTGTEILVSQNTKTLTTIAVTMGGMALGGIICGPIGILLGAQGTTLVATSIGGILAGGGLAGVLGGLFVAKEKYD